MNEKWERLLVKCEWHDAYPTQGRNGWLDKEGYYSLNLPLPTLDNIFNIVVSKVIEKEPEYMTFSYDGYERIWRVEIDKMNNFLTCQNKELTEALIDALDKAME